MGNLWWPLENRGVGPAGARVKGGPVRGLSQRLLPQKWLELLL